MGHYQDTTVEITYKGKTTRVAKEDAHLYLDKKEKSKEQKTDK